MLVAVACWKQRTTYFWLCSFFGTIWQLVCNWLGVGSADPSILADHFLQFGNSSGHVKPMTVFMSLIWFSSAMIIWKERNDRIFRGKPKYPLHLLENIKLLSFWWFKTKFVVFLYEFYNLCHSPFLCLGIGQVLFDTAELLLYFLAFFPRTSCARKIVCC